MTTLQAVIWDVDGTLADTEMKGHRIAFNYAFKKCGINWNWDEETYAQLLKIQGGKSRIIKYGLDQNFHISSEKLSKLLELKKNHYTELILSGKVSLRLGVKRLLKEINAAGIDQWIVTTSSYDSLLPLINSNFPVNTSPFNGFITSEDVINPKPHPEAYLKACQSCGVPTSRILVIEDSVWGLQSANSAGLSVLVTLSPWIKEISAIHSSAKSVVTHLGDSHESCKVFKGPPCPKGQITLKYLQSLI